MCTRVLTCACTKSLEEHWGTCSPWHTSTEYENNERLRHAHTHKCGVPHAQARRREKKDKMEVTHSGCRAGTRGHEEKPHSAEEKDTLMQKASASRLSVSSGSWRTDGREAFLFQGCKSKDIISLFSVLKYYRLHEDVVEMTVRFASVALCLAVSESTSQF